MRCLQPDDLAFVWEVLLQHHGFPVENGIGEVLDPVAQADDGVVVGDQDLVGDVAVSEYEVVHIGILFQVVFGKHDLVLILQSLEQ